jgi:pentapeptide MXKDX repeat protein
MKKIITILTAMAVVLTFGVAFAQEQKMAEPEKKEEMAPMKKEMKKEKKKAAKKKKMKKEEMKKEEMKKEEMKKEEAAPMAPAGK